MQFVTTQHIHLRPRRQRKSLYMMFVRGIVQCCTRLSDGLAIGFSHGFDSGLSCDYIYRGQTTESTKIGRLIDQYYLNHPITQAFRMRTKLLQQQLLPLLLERRKQGLSTHILDLASGVGSYHLELLCMLEGNDIHLTCVDQDEAVLAYGRDRAVQYNLADRVLYIHGDATDVTNLRKISPKPDILVVSGLYELLHDDAEVCWSLMAIRSLLSDQGHLFFTNQIHFPHRELIAQILKNRQGQPMEITTRPVSRVERWAREAGFRQVHSEIESEHLCSVTQCAI